MSVWDDFRAEREAEVEAFNAAEAAKSPEQVAAEAQAIADAAEARHREGVRLGWWDEAGTVLVEQPEEEQEAD